VTRTLTKTAVRRLRPRPDPFVSALVAEGFLSRLAFGLLSFALPLYALELGLGLAAIGLLASFNTAVAMVLKMPAGALADRVGLRRTLLAAMGLRSLVCLALATVTVPWQLFATRALHGTSIALRDPSVNALLAEHGGSKAVASAFAWYQTAKSLAGALGKTIAGVLLTVTAGSFSTVFLISFVLSGLPVLLVAWALRGARSGTVGSAETDAATDAPASPDPANAAPPRKAAFLGLGFFISGTSSMLSALFPVLATEYAGLSPAQAGLIYMVSVVAVLTGPVFGWLADHVSHRLVFRFRSVANAGSSLIYLASPTFAGFTVGRILDDAGKAAFKPAWGAVMAHVASYDKRRRAQTMGLLSMGEDAGDVLGPIVAGLLWTIGGVPLLLGTRAALAVVADGYTLVLTRRLGPSSPLLRRRSLQRGEAVSPAGAGRAGARTAPDEPAGLTVGPAYAASPTAKSSTASAVAAFEAAERRACRVGAVAREAALRARLRAALERNRELTEENQRLRRRLAQAPDEQPLSIRRDTTTARPQTGVSPLRIGRPQPNGDRQRWGARPGRR